MATKPSHCDIIHKGLCGPLANSRFHHRPPQHRPDSRLEAAYHRADKAIEKVVDLLAAARPLRLPIGRKHRRPQAQPHASTAYRPPHFYAKNRGILTFSNLLSPSTLTSRLTKLLDASSQTTGDRESKDASGSVLSKSVAIVVNWVQTKSVIPVIAGFQNMRSI